MRRLRRVLAADAVVCGIFGAALSLFPAALGRLVAGDLTSIAGVSTPTALRAVGLAVLAIGFGVVVAARSDPIRPAAVVSILIIEIIWVVASLLIILMGRDHLTAAGLGVVFAGAVVVGVFFVLELRGLRSLRETSTAGQGSLR